MGCCPSDEQVEHGVKESSGEGAFDLGLEEQRSSDRWVAVCAASMPGQAAHSARSVSSTYSENRKAELRCVSNPFDPMVGSPPGSSVHGLSQARTLE